MKYASYNINYDKWSRVVLRAQLLITGCIFITEIVGNALLYSTRSQGYGPDTIVEKLIRYLLVTTLINVSSIVVSQIIIRRSKDQSTQKFAMMLSTVVICTNVSFSHYQFANTLVIFIFPIILSILFEDISISFITLLLCLLGATISVIARSIDSAYNADIGPEAAITYMFIIGIFTLSRLLSNTLVTRRLELGDAIVNAEKANASAERSKLSLKMLETLARAIDAKDSYTNGHSARVAVYSTVLAEALGWDKEQIEILKFEALLHDIGKIGVPDTVLNKPSRLTESEFNIIKSHTLVGADILKDMVAVPGAKDVAKYHHERYDGTGYPSFTSGEDIPLSARIVCIADSFDAMNSDRVYRKALKPEIIREELIKGRGSQFDPELLDVFLDLFDNHKLNIRADALSVIESDVEQAYVMEDIEKVIYNLTSIEDHANSTTDFEKFYKYMRNIGIRYNRSIEVMSVIITPSEGYAPTDADNADAASAIEFAIKKNIRSVDVYYRYSPFVHMIILLDAGTENIDIITHRISFDFSTNKISESYDVSYELNENISYPRNE